MAFVKWIGGALGFAMGGPIGALMGFAFGSMFDGAEEDPSQRRINPGSGGRAAGYERYRHQTKQGDFAASLLILSAAVMKADGKHLKSELDYIREFFQRQFGDDQAAYHMGVLKELLKKDIPLREVCGQIKYFMEHPARLQLMHFMFGIALADGHVHSSEERVISQMASYLGISSRDYQSIKAMFYKNDAASAYKILEIDKNVTEAELKKAHRKMVKKYHPDRLKGLGETQMKAGESKFIEVQKAYENIKKEKGWN